MTRKNSRRTFLKELVACPAIVIRCATPKKSRRLTEEKGIRQKMTKEDRRHEEKTAGGRKLSSPKARNYHYKTGEETRLRVDADQERGGGKNSL